VFDVRVLERLHPVRLILATHVRVLVVDCPVVIVVGHLLLVGLASVFELWRNSDILKLVMVLVDVGVGF
jgi:hypothetical protein